MTARQQGRCSRRSAVALASNIITYFAYMRLHLQFHWLCGMLSSCGAVELWSCESLLLCCPQSGKKAKQKKRRTCAASHPHRWLVAACCMLLLLLLLLAACPNNCFILSKWKAISMQQLCESRPESVQVRCLSLLFCIWQKCWQLVSKIEPAAAAP